MHEKYRGGVSKSDLLSPLYHILFINTDGIPICGALWFLTALFFCEVFYYVIDRKVKQSAGRVFSICLCVGIGYSIPFFTRLPFAIDTALVGVGLFYIGNQYKTIRNKFSHDGYGYLICLLLGSMMALINGYVNLREGIYGNLLLFFLSAVFMTYGLHRLCVKGQYLRIPYFMEEVKFIGRNSLVYVCLNQVIILFLNKATLYFRDQWVLFLLLKLASVILCLMILHIGTYILNKKYFRWMLGK